MKEKILILSTYPLDNDPRVLREIEWLKDIYDITTLTTAPSKIQGVNHVVYKPRASSAVKKVTRGIKYLTKNYEELFWREEVREASERLKKSHYSRILANDYDTLPIAFDVASKDTRILFDAHEYAPEHFDDQWQWRLMVKPVAKAICAKFIPKVDSAWTVCRGLADKYEENFGKKFEVITNAPEFVDQRPTQTDPDKIRIIFHGMATESRNTHLQIEMMKLLDKRFELNLMLVGNSPYVQNLKKLAEGMDNVKFLPPVETAEIAGFTNQFDIGLFLLPPVNPNYKFILPNKFFEFIQARLAVAIGPSIEMKRLVEKHDLGIVSEDFTPEKMAEAINKLTVDKIMHYKLQSDKSARELSADMNKEKFISLVNGNSD